MLKVVSLFVGATIILTYWQPGMFVSLLFLLLLCLSAAIGVERR